MEQRANAMKAGVRWVLSNLQERMPIPKAGRRGVKPSSLLCWHPARHRFLDVACFPKGLIFDFIQKATRGREIDDKRRN